MQEWSLRVIVCPINGYDEWMKLPIKIYSLEQ
jgi:hypothetical protein